MQNFEEKDFTDDNIKLSIWKKIFKIVFKRKKNIILMLLFISLLSLLDIFSPLLNKFALDNFFSDNPDFSLKYIYLAVYGLVAIGFAFSVWGFIRMAGIVEVEVGYQIREEAFKNLQILPFSYYDKTPAGWIMARLTSDSRKLASIISWGLIDLLWGAMMMTGTIIVMLIYNWRLGLIIVGLLPILFVVSMYFRKKILIAYRDVRKINSNITASYNEGILGNKTTKTLTLEPKKERDFNTLANDMRKSSIKAIIRSSIFFPIILVLSYTAVMLILRVGGGYIVNEKFGFTVAMLYTFIAYTQFFFEPVMQIARVLAEMQQAQASAERIISLIETKPEIFDSPEVIEKYGTILDPIRENFEELHGDIEFKNVGFSYNEKEIILDNFNLKVKQGTSVALVGATGSGKSTIVNLICRFYEPTSGEILIDGKNYKERSLTWLHENLGYVLQTPHLFNTSILENIRYGNLEASDEEVIKAAKLARVDDFVVDMTDGYNTLVGEGGSKLSVGQRQLVSFARALVADPRILVLDEATSSIDTNTEVIIQDVVKTILKGRTSFIVAHRLSTIVNSDLIIVIDDGRILESGTHRELLEKRGEYYNLYKNQFIDEKLKQSAK